jgi:hypothetical protein
MTETLDVRRFEPQPATGPQKPIAIAKEAQRIMDVLYDMIKRDDVEQVAVVGETFDTPAMYAELVAIAGGAGVGVYADGGPPTGMS